LRKILNISYLKKYGWTGIDVGRGHIVTYCKTCRSQSIHYCTGKKPDNGQTLLRFECAVCQEKINGNRYNGKKNYGPIFKAPQRFDKSLRR